MEKKRQYAEYNKIIKENDDIYHELAKSYGLSDCTFWILYILRAEAESLTQSEMCALLYQPKQTVNSALKKMKRDGLITMFTEDNDRRSKRITLSAVGIEFAEHTVDHLISAEKASLDEMPADELNEFLFLFRKLINLLRANIEKRCELSEKCNDNNFCG